jgi:trans-2,3-dihydro-3-hydroxyanthranilate isomerase
VGPAFRPSLGVDEDPATGSGAAVLAGCLAQRAGRDGVHAWRIAQGVLMGRPSRIEAAAETKGAQVAKIWVGGQTAIVAEGAIQVPAGY